MNNFIFYNPTKIVFGTNTIPTIGSEIKSYGIKKVLLLYGGNSAKKNGVLDTVIHSLQKSNIEYIEYSGVRPNPEINHANEAISIIKEHSLEAVIAVGGGSVIDESKAISAGSFVDDLWDLIYNKKIITNGLPIFTVLTLSGTGSEMNGNAVISNDSINKKLAIGSRFLYPRVSIIDPSIQSTLPWQQTVNGGIDAMTHVMEFYFLGTNEEIVLSQDEAIMNTIIKSIDLLQIDSLDYNARANLAWASTLALNGISGIALKGGDWAVHQIEHSLSAYHVGIAHGTGLGIIYPAWIQYVYKNNINHFERWADKIWHENSIDLAIITMKNKFASWKAPIALSQIGIGKSEIPMIAKNVLTHGLPGALMKLEQKNIEEILYLAY